MLRAALRQPTASPALQRAIVEFLKSHDSLAATRHILRQLLANLDSVADRMPQNAAAQLRQAAARLPQHLPNGGQAQAVAQMKPKYCPCWAST